MARCQLMPEKKVLDFKPEPRLEQISDKRSKQVDDGKMHRMMLQFSLSAQILPD